MAEMSPNSIRILHVDDEPDFADMAATFLEAEDERFTVETATNAAEGLKRLSSDIDCIVSDYDMPGQNGIELLERVREEYPDLPFILFTGKGSEEVASDAIAAGVTGYLQKGTDTDHYTILAHRITNAVRAHRSATAARQRRHRFEQIIKTVPGCVVQLDTDGRFIFANRRAEEVLGLERSAVTGRKYNAPEWDIRDLNGEPIPDEKLPFRQVLDSGEPVYDYRHSIQFPTGERTILLVNGAPLFDDEGAIKSVVFSLTDITDQHERKHDLEKAERRLQLALEATDTGVWEWDRETDTVFWNETLERVMGLEPGEFEGTFDAFIERVHPDDMSEVSSQLDDALDTDSPYDTEFRMRHEDGSFRWAAVRGQLVGDAGNERMVGVHQDITDRKELETELAATLEQYKTLVENVPRGGVFLYNEEYECLLAGGAGLSQHGLSSDDVVGSRPRDRYPPRIAEELEAHIQDAFEGEHSTFEQTYDGRHYRIWILPVGDAGTSERVMAVSQEITQQKEREQELERYESIVENTEDGIYVFDDRGRFEFVNQRVIDVSGISLDGWIGEHVSIHADLGTLSEAEVSAIEDGIEAIVDGEETEVRIELRPEIPHDIGTLELRLTSFQTTDGKSQVIGFSRDITDQKEYERELERQNERLDEFAGVVSHDLRNPLNVASGRLELVADECESDQIETIERAHKRMETLIDDLLILAREGEQVRDTEAVELGAFAVDCWHHIESGEASINTDTDLHIQADTSRLRQLLVNLMQNAVEHGGTDVTITVGMLEDGFYIEDDGAGIPPADRTQVFEAGYSTVRDGTGFGLSIVRRVVEAHEWDIRVTDGTDGGARFEIIGVEFATE